MQARRLTSLTALLLLSLTIAGCSGEDTRTEEQDPAVLVESRGPLNDIQRQQLIAAADELSRQAAQSPSPQREQSYMKSVEYYLKADQTAQAEANARNINSAKLNPSDLYTWHLLSAELNMKRGSPDQALHTLQGVSQAQATPEQHIRFMENKAQALKQAGNMLESARVRNDLDGLLANEEAKAQNQLEIVTTLAGLSDTALELLQPKPADNLTGWMELARVFKRSGNDFVQARPAYEEWRKRFPGHPAIKDLFGRHYGQVQVQQASTAPPAVSQIAVLLPQSGPLQKPATALRNGIMAAHHANTGGKPVLRFYDSSNESAVLSLYQQAIAEGAKVVIGPLDKAEVARLMVSGDLPVPVLALNQVAGQGTPPNNFYQFALSPEEEAQQVAERAWNDGHRRGIAMVPEGAWGTRIASAFSERWKALGGVLVEEQFYKESTRDFSEQIKKLLSVDKSEARFNKLKKDLGRSMEFEARLRGDAGFIFLAASPEMARQIRPQLLFHHAGKLPTYSTSRIFSGVLDPRQDRDLNGMLFPDIPWLILSEDDSLSRAAVAKQFPDSLTNNPRLYAMGIDSYQLALRMAEFTRGGAIDGKTGTLSLGSGGQVQRRLVWAEMAQGVPRPVGYFGSPAVPTTPTAQPNATPAN